jgi:hypothetical protein
MSLTRLSQDKVTGTILTHGGSLASTSGHTWFVFPRDVFTQTVNVTYRHLWTDHHTGSRSGIGRAFDVDAVYADAGEPAQLAPGRAYVAVVQYTDAQVGPAIESTLAFYAWDGSRWLRESTSVVDVAHNTVVGTLDHLGQWAVLGEKERVFLPFVAQDGRAKNAKPTAGPGSSKTIAARAAGRCPTLPVR